MTINGIEEKTAVKVFRCGGRQKAEKGYKKLQEEFKRLKQLPNNEHIIEYFFLLPLQKAKGGGAVRNEY